VPAETGDRGRSWFALPSQVWLVCAGACVNRFGSFAQVFLIIYLHQERGYSVAAAGAAVAVYGLGSVTSAAAGHLADRVGYGWAILISMLLTAATLVAIPAVGSPWLLPVLGFAGFATDLYRSAAAALISTHDPVIREFAMRRLEDTERFIEDGTNYTEAWSRAVELDTGLPTPPGRQLLASLSLVGDFDVIALFIPFISGLVLGIRLRGNPGS
jgi:hypothetical protein